MNRTLACAAVVLASSAVGQEDDLQVPVQPAPVKAASNLLNFFWRECLRDAYPADPEAGVEKMSSLVTFKRVGSQYRGEVRIGLHTLDGVDLPPNRVQSAFVACVKRQFDSHSLGSVSSQELDGTRMAIANPFNGASVVERGELGRQRAVQVVAHQLELAKAHCGTKTGRVSVVVDTNPDGSPGAVAVTGAAGTTACVEKRLMKTLRFPVVASRNRVEVPQPAPAR